MKKSIIFLLLAAFSGLCAAEGTLYVQSAKAKLLASPSFKAEVIAVAPKGEPLALKEKVKRWAKVGYQGSTGWVSELLVSDTPPKDKVTILKNKDNEDQKANVRRRASSTATAAAARGLREDGRVRVNDQARPDWEALEVMESYQASEEEASEFMQDGAEN